MYFQTGGELKGGGLGRGRVDVTEKESSWGWSLLEGVILSLIRSPPLDGRVTACPETGVFVIISRNMYVGSPIPKALAHIVIIIFQLCG